MTIAIGSTDFILIIISFLHVIKNYFIARCVLVKALLDRVFMIAF
uniref:Uncharacterized protein n=1 Tax=Pseudoalteromonas luteoviolacea TaxID=43657 RepID=A0A023Q0R5_9GAMM|nr:hypothetical protein [Pseudoalteromonas luteoviolacea]